MHNYHRYMGPPCYAFKIDIQKAYDTVDWRYHKHCKDLDLINVCFADDLFIFSWDYVESARVIIESLDEFKSVLGLVLSLPKSTVFFCNVKNHVKSTILNAMPFSEGTLLVIYLGVPLISSRLLNQDCILLDIQQLMRGFLWYNGELKRGKAKVAWDDICLPKNEGGLGIRNALCTKYHIPACVHPTLPGLDKDILQNPNGKLKFLTLRSYVAATDFNLLSIVSACSTLVPTLRGGCRLSSALTRLLFAIMDLFAFIRHSDPTKVRIWERDLMEREVKLLKMTEGRTVSLDPPVTAASGDSGDSIDKLFDEGDDNGQEHSVKRDDDVLEETIAKDVSKKLREDYHVANSITGGKSLSTIHSLILEGFSIPSGITEPRDDGLANSMSGLNLRTFPPSKRYVISSDDSHYSDSRSEVNFFARYAVMDTPVMTIAITTTVAADASVIQVSKDKVRSGNLETFRDSVSAGGANVNATSSSKLNKPMTSSDYFYASQDLDSETLHNIYVPKWKVTNDSILDDSYVCRDLTDRLAPPALFSQLRSMDYDQLYTEFNVGAARQMCLGAEVRMRAEHTLEQKDRLKDKCVEQTTLLSEKDAEIVHLRSLLLTCS
ncbi:hypothetical protein Tco_0667430 [Tanacetum coccineum]